MMTQAKTGIRVTDPPAYRLKLEELLGARDPRELLDTFRAIRGFNLCVRRALEPADLKRLGKHDERGSESLADMLVMLAGRDLWHIDQLTRYLAAAEAP